RLVTPILLGSSITVASGSAGAAMLSGSAVRAVPNGGTIAFALDTKIASWLADQFHWIDRTFRIYQGFSATGDRAALTLIYPGRVANLTYDTTTPQSPLTTPDAAADLNKPIGRP